MVERCGWKANSWG